MRILFARLLLCAGVFAAGAAAAQDIKIALISGRTGPLEAYAKQTEAGFMLGLEYLTDGTMEVNGRKIVVLSRTTRASPTSPSRCSSRPTATTRSTRRRHRPPRARRSPCCRSPRNTRSILIVEPAVADQITGDKWNRYVFRTARNSTQDALAAAVALGKGDVSIATLAQDYAFGRDGVAALKDALAATKSSAKVVLRGIRAAEHHRLHRARRSASSTR